MQKIVAILKNGLKSFLLKNQRETISYHNYSTVPAANKALAQLGQTEGISAAYLAQTFVVGLTSPNPPADFCYAL